MRGGNRVGAGRKTIPDSQKKKSKNIYITNELYDCVMTVDLEDCNGFSQRCLELIEMGLEKMNECDNQNELGVCNTLPSCDNSDIYDDTKYEQLENCSTDESIKFIDLFAGIGGIRKGFEDSKTKCVFSSEWDKYAAKTYEANYGEKPHGDITQIHEDDIPDHDVLLAGFPCQPFSNIGKREGFLHETQGTLFFDVLRIINKKQPKMFLLENVKGLLTNDNGNTFRTIIESLETLNYSVFHDVLDAQNFGLPQRRERVVIVGFHPDIKVNDFIFPQGDISNRKPISSILEHNPKGYSISKHLQKSYLFKKNDNKPQLVSFDSDIQVNTLVASYHKIQRLTGTFVKDGETGVRLFSESELKKLMGFSDDFIIPVSRTQMYRQFGNSVAVPMIKAIADAMKAKLRLAESIPSEKIC